MELNEVLDPVATEGANMIVTQKRGNKVGVALIGGAALIGAACLGAKKLLEKKKKRMEIKKGKVQIIPDVE